MKKKFRYIAFINIMLLLFTTAANAQNINRPNKTGPMGLQVNMLSGNLFFSRTDLSVPARGLDIDIRFSYNSQNSLDDYGFGRGWAFSYGIQYRNDTGGAKIIFWGDGREEQFRADGNGGFLSPRGNYGQLTQYQSGKYRYRTKEGVEFYFDNATHRKVTSIKEPNNNSLSFSYTDSLLTTVSSAAGQIVSFTYENGRLKTVTEATALPTKIYNYSYDGAGNLITVTDPLRHQQRYTYLTNGPIKTVTDKNNNTVHIIYYNDFAVSEIVGCNRRIGFSYDEASLSSYATDFIASGSNQVTKYGFKKFDDVVWLSEQSGNCCGNNIRFEYDGNGNVIKETDANGNSYTYTFDALGNNLTATDPLNQKKSYTYSENFNRVTSSTDAKGATTSFQYDSRGNLIRLNQPMGLSAEMTYAANGDLLSVKDAKGAITTFSYDAWGGLASITDALNHTSGFSHNARGDLLSSTDAKGLLYQYQYDTLSRVIELISPLNTMLHFFYDAEDNLIKTINENGQRRSYAYDAANRVVAATNHLGNQTFLVYDEMNNVVQMKDALGNTMNATYNNRNRVTSVRDAAGNTTRFDYDNNANLSSITYPTGRVIFNTYDKLNRLVTASDALGTLGTISYDANNNIVSINDAASAVRSFTYDALNRVTTATDALGAGKTYSYDANGNLLSSRDRNGNTMSYVYDALNRVLSCTDENSFTTQLAYDANGNVVSVTDALNNSTQYIFDNLNRLTRVGFADGKYMHFTLDNLGNVIGKRMPDGRSINFQYDSLNRLTQKAVPGGTTNTYQYDVLNRVVAVNNEHALINLAYDNISRIVAESINGKTTRHSYNTAATIINTLYADSTLVTKSFDQRYRLTNVSKGNIPVVAYTYNAANQVIAANFGNGIASNYQYDFANRLAGISSAVQNQFYTYDKELNLASISRPGAATNSEQFSYDAGYRLVQHTRGSNTSSFQYNAVGNRTQVTANGQATTYSNNLLNQLATANGSSTIAYQYDDNGNLAFDGSFYKSYDAEGKLLSDSASPGNKILYQYDGFGRRLRKTTASRSQLYTYDGLAQTTVFDSGTDTVLQRTFFSNFTAPLASETGGKRYYYHLNHQNSVEAITNEAGGLTEQYRYDAYGSQARFDATNNPLSTSPSGNRFGFTGQEWDGETGTVAFHFRNYSPVTGRFHQRDPIGYGDGMSLYQYTGNNPATYVDPLGLQGGPLSSLGGDPLQDILNLLNNGTTGLGEALDRAEPGITKAINDLHNGMIKNNAQIRKLEKAMSKYPKDAAKYAKSIENFRNSNKLLNAELLKVMTRFEKLLKFVKRAGPLFNTLDLYYKVWKARQPKLDECGNPIPRGDYEQARLNMDVMLSTASYTPHGAAYSLFDWGVELSTGKGATTWFMDVGEAHYNWMDRHPYLAAAENYTLGLPGYLEGRYQVSENVNNFMTYPAYLAGYYGW